MNLEELRAVQEEERRTASPQPLPDGFYDQVTAYLDELKERRAQAAAAADDPWGSDEVGRLTDEIETATDVVESIWENRVGEIVKRASLSATGMSVDESGLTPEERDLFRSIVLAIENHRADIFDEIDDPGPTVPVGERDGIARPDEADGSSRPNGDATDTTAPPSSEDDPSAESGAGESGAPGVDAHPGSPSDTEESTPPARPPDGEPGPPSGQDGPDPTAGEGTSGVAGGATTAASGEAVERVTVRITRDVGTILGVDEREYHLARDDVATLPRPNADPLLERDAAERID